jgi:hypothetical protein
MSRTQNYIPRKDARFDEWLGFLTRFVVSKTCGGAPAWTHIPSEALKTLSDDYARWHDAWTQVNGPHTSGDTLYKNETRKAAESFVRPFVNQYLRFPPVTDADRTSMGIHNRDKVATRIKKPHTVPLILQIDSRRGRLMLIRFRDESVETGEALPYGCSGCLLRFAWGPKRLNDTKELTECCVMTASPYLLTKLPPEAQGMWLSCCVQWLNTRGEEGPESDIFYAIIL